MSTTLTCAQMAARHTVYSYNVYYKEALFRDLGRTHSPSVVLGPDSLTYYRTVPILMTYTVAFDMCMTLKKVHCSIFSSLTLVRLYYNAAFQQYNLLFKVSGRASGLVLLVMDQTTVSCSSVDSHREKG